ncbi:hypothetical protein Tco_0359016 [Tanacetum coccineum]
MSTLNNSNQQTLADSGSNKRPQMLEKGNYFPWESRFRRFLDNKLEDEEQMVKKSAKNHDPLALIAYSNASSSHSHANSSYSPQPYYVTHPSSIVNYDDKYQGELQGDSQEDKLTTAMMNQAVVQDGRVDIQIKNSVDDNAENVPSYDAKAVSEVHTSSKVYEQVNHEKRKTIIQTTDDDQIDSRIIFDDSIVENNGGSSKHDSNAHNEYHEIQLLAYNVQREAKNQKQLNNELKKQKQLLQRELKTFKDRVCQMIHMLGKTPHKVYDSFLKVGLGYKNHERLKKAIAVQPKLYNCDLLQNDKLIIDSPNSEETLQDAKESRLKMRNKMVKLNYEKLNASYEIFVPQQELSAEQTYFSIPSTSNNISESKDVPLELPTLKILKESRLLKMFDTMGVAINSLQTRIDKTLLQYKQ